MGECEQHSALKAIWHYANKPLGGKKFDDFATEASKIFGLVLALWMVTAAYFVILQMKVGQAPREWRWFPLSIAAMMAYPMLAEFLKFVSHSLRRALHKNSDE